MLSPDEILRISEGAEDIAEELHQDILNRVIDRIMARIGRQENYRLTAVDKWQLETLKDAGFLMDDVQKEISKRTGMQMKEIKAAFEDAGVRSARYDDAVYEAAGLSPTPLLESPQYIRILQRGYNATNGEWKNFTRTLAGEAQQTFIRECDRAYHQVMSGSVSYTQAVREAINRLADDGVKVHYPSGRTDTIETATMRAVRTGISQACADVTDARMEEMDWDIILVSAHLGARYTDQNNYTNHMWWQGKFYSKSGKDKRFPPFSVCGFGNVQGICGANCRHSYGPGDGEFNPYDKIDTEENKRAYDLSQEQRGYERKIRDTKRKTMAIKEGRDAADDKAIKDALDLDYQKSAAKLQEQNKAYKEFCEKNGLKTRAERTQIAKWDREQAAQARGAAARYKNTKNQTLDVNKKVDTLKRNVDTETISVNLQSGASGAKIKPEKDLERHAELYYEEVRNRKPYSDAAHISRNVPEFSMQEIEEIRRHLFLDEIPRDGGIKRFDASYEQSLVWQRLIEGKNIKKSDIVFLKHEKKELTIMREMGYNYERAHELAEKEYSWVKSLREEE